MAHYTNVFSPETYKAFSDSSRTVSGFKERQRGIAAKIKRGDILVCYLTKLSRWCGLLEVVGEMYEDNTPIFMPDADPYVLRFKVIPRVWLPLEASIPIHDDSVWPNLSFTQDQPKDSSTWTSKIRSSLAALEGDGSVLDRLLTQQLSKQTIYPLSEQDQKELVAHKVSRTDKVVSVSVPDDKDNDIVPALAAQIPEVRESIKIQSLIAQIGHKMGMSVWIPASDRAGVLKEWKDAAPPLLTRLPLSYDETTLRTIEQIDVLWLRGRSIVRAFEVEHTTSVYSGILRMADLLALQPNMQIKLHIVAPIERREKVFSEIRRPVFSLLDRGPLAETCTYLSYEDIRELAAQKLISHLSDTVLDEFAQEAE